MLYRFRSIKWAAISSGDRAYLRSAYQRYTQLLEASSVRHQGIISFAEWLQQRGIHDYLLNPSSRTVRM